VDPSNTAAVEKLVLDKLAELAETGFTPGAIEAAVNTIEFSLRENNTGSFPRGLSLMLRAMGAWIYGRDPYTPIQWEDALTTFKARLASGEDVFGPLIRKYLLENMHRVSVTMLPDTGLAARVEADERARLDAIRAGLSETEVCGVL
jgi:presequence protease